MIYEVIKDSITLKIDDNVFFDKQPKEFRQMYEAARTIGYVDNNGDVIVTAITDNAEFDNCFIEAFENGRVIITLKQDEDVTV
ncbi:MAG: hypothetical protein LBQ74_03950 [Prevotella sp.]|jgi:hypothetical protein|nr:hypothetical protein [Prevotella sp.]